MTRTALWIAAFLQHRKKNNNKKINSIGAAAFLLSVAGWGASVQAQATQAEPTVWAHKVSWTTISNLNHTQRRDFPLGMGQGTWPGQPHRQGDQSTIDDTTACALAQSAGIDAFALDIFPSAGLSSNLSIVTERLNAAAALTAETGKQFYVSPCLDTPVQYTPSQTASLISGLVGGLSQRPEWPKFNGVPIVWSYNATSASSSYWQQVFSQLNAQNVKVDIVLDADALFAQADASLPTADLDAYATLPVALYSFGGNNTSPGVAGCRQYLAANDPNSLAAQLTIGTVRPGYWNEIHGGYGDPQGTQALRNGFAAANSSRWITITTWDDYGENTQVEPSLNMGTGRLDLLHALIAARQGQSWPSKSQFYLWQPSEIHGLDPVLGAVSGEALALLPEGQTPATVQVNLCDSNQNILVAGTPTTFTTGGVHAMPYSFTLPQMPSSRAVYLSLTCQSGDFPQKSFLSEPVAVWPSDNPWRTMTGLMWQAGTLTKQTPVTVISTRSIPQIEKDQFTSFAGQFFPLLNSNLVTFPNFGSRQFSDYLGLSQSLGPDSWDTFAAIPSLQRWGFFDAKGINPDGTLCWSPPVWVEPAGGYSAVTSSWHFNEGKGTQSADATSYANTVSLQGSAGWATPGQTGAACLALDGVNGSVSVPQGIFPMGSFTFTAQIKPTLSAGATSYSHDQFIFCDVAASLLLRVRADGRLQVQRTDCNGFETATGTTIIPANQWSQVTVTYDQQTLRLYYLNHLEATVACTGTRINTITAIGVNPSDGSGHFQGCIDEVQIQAQVTTPTGGALAIITPDQQTNLWHLDDGSGTTAVNATPYGVALTLQGTTAWSKPGQTGAACLAFDGQNSSVTVPNGCVPHGSFTFTAQIKPTLSAGATGYTPNTNQDIFSDTAGALVVYLRNGCLTAQRTDGNGWEHAYGTTQVPVNQWSQVTVTYDQQTLSIYLGSHLEATVACTGTHVNANTLLGCNSWNGGCDYFQGCIDEVQFQPQVVTPAGSNATITTPDQQINLWHLDDGSGTTAVNATPYGVALTLQGTTAWSKPGQTGAACLAFDGQNSSVTVPNGCVPHGSFTFTAQIKPTLSAGATGYTPNTNQDIFSDTAGALVVYLRNGCLTAQRTDGNGWEHAYGTTQVPVNQWSQVTVTYDQQTLSIYLGSHLEATVACTGTHVNANTLLGCNSWNGGCDYFQGCIDEVQIHP